MTDYPFDVTTPGTVTIGGETFNTKGKLYKSAPGLPNPRTDTGDDILHIGQAATGAGDGSSASDLIAVADVLGFDYQDAVEDPTQYKTLKLYGRLSRFSTDGPDTTQGVIRIGAGSASEHTQVVFDSGAELMGGVKLGTGTSGDGVWTANGDGGSTSTGNDTYSSVQTGSMSLLSSNNSTFALTVNGSDVVIPLTRVTSLANCQATADSIFYEVNYSGSDDRITVHLTRDVDPTEEVFIASMSRPGIELGFEHSDYVDVYGGTIYQSGWDFDDIPHFYAYGTKLSYVGGAKAIDYNSPEALEGCGQFSHQSDPSAGNAITVNVDGPPQERIFRGVMVEYASDAFYDGNSAGRVPVNTTIKDCYVRKIGVDEFGINLGNTDSHSYACMGADGWTVDNCAAEDCGWVNIVVYLSSQNIATPGTTITDAAITNGTFDTDLTGWTDSSQGTGTASVVGGKLRLTCSDSTTNFGQVDQQVSIGASYQSDLHYLLIDVYDVSKSSGSDPVLHIGTSQGDNSLASIALDASTRDAKDDIAWERYCVAFNPGGASSVWVRVKFAVGLGGGTQDFDNIRIISDLSAEPAYSEGLSPRIDNGDSTERYYVPGKNITIKNCYLHTIVTNADNSALNSSGHGIYLNGDNDHYGGPSMQIDNVKVHDNILVGAWTRAIANKFNLQTGSAKEKLQIYHNAISGALTSYRTFTTATDENGDTVGRIEYFHHNLSHNPTTRHILLDNLVDPSLQELYFDENHYSYETSDATNPWNGSTDYSTLALWQTAALAGDVHDDNSTHGEDLGLPELPSTGTVQMLTGVGT